MSISWWENFKTWYGKNPIHFFHILFLLFMFVLFMVGFIIDSIEMLTMATLILCFNGTYALVSYVINPTINIIHLSHMLFMLFIFVLFIIGFVNGSIEMLKLAILGLCFNGLFLLLWLILFIRLRYSERRQETGDFVPIPFRRDI